MRSLCSCSTKAPPPLMEEERKDGEAGTGGWGSLKSTLRFFLLVSRYVAFYVAALYGRESKHRGYHVLFFGHVKNKNIQNYQLHISQINWTLDYVLFVFIILLVVPNSFTVHHVIALLSSFNKK